MKKDWYYIGMIWALGSLNSENFLIRHSDERAMIQILEYINSAYTTPKYSLVAIEAANKTYFQTKVHLFNPKIFFIWNHLGFVGRQNEERGIPKEIPSEQIYSFLVGYAQVGHWSYEIKRLRFYGNEAILTLYNNHISEIFGRKLMKLQKHKQSDIVKILYYQGNGINEIAEYFDIKLR